MFPSVSLMSTPTPETPCACPFCGRAAKDIEYEDGAYFGVECLSETQDECPLGSIGYYPSIEKAIAAWNRRSPLVEAQARLAEAVDKSQLANNTINLLVGADSRRYSEEIFSAASMMERAQREFVIALAAYRAARGDASRGIA